MEGCSKSGSSAESVAGLMETDAIRIGSAVEEDDAEDDEEEDELDAEFEGGRADEESVARGLVASLSLASIISSA